MKALPFYLEHFEGDVWRGPDGRRWRVRIVLRDGSLELKPFKLRNDGASYRAGIWPKEAECLFSWRKLSSAIPEERTGAIRRYLAREDEPAQD